MTIQGIRPSLNSNGFNASPYGVLPASHTLRELDIRMPLLLQSLSFAEGDKSAKKLYGNPQLARQPAPNVIILINDKNDLVAINGTHINAPHRTLVIVAHGGPGGVQKADGNRNYSAKELANLIKQKTGNTFKQYDQIVFVSCRVALAGKDHSKVAKQDGSYTQTIANALGKPVYAATEFGYVNSNGRLTIAGSITEKHGERKIDDGDLGRFIKFYPSGKPANSSALQNALKEHDTFPEDKIGSGTKADLEFKAQKIGRCVNATVLQCMGK